MRSLVTRGAPQTSDTDLLLIFWQGLKPAIREQARVDPRTGTWWSEFEDLVKHCLAIDTSFTPVRLNMMGAQDSDNKGQKRHFSGGTHGDKFKKAKTGGPKPFGKGAGGAGRGAGGPRGPKVGPDNRETHQGTGNRTFPAIQCKNRKRYGHYDSHCDKPPGAR